MALLILGLMSTVGVYAASITGATRTLGGSGAVTVGSGVTGTATTSYTLTGADVTAVNVLWTPAATGTYTIQVTTGGIVTTGTLTGVAGVAATPMTSIVPLAATAASGVTSVSLVINQTG
jgi:hypothetical protein